MSHVAFPFWAVYQVLENRLALGEALGFAEIARLGGSRSRQGERLRRNLRRLIEEADIPSLQRRHIAMAPTVSTVALTLDPPPGESAWRAPLALTFAVLRWRHGHDAEIAFVPALGIEVVASKPGTLDSRLPIEIRAALVRDAPLTLARLVAWQRVSHVQVERLTVDVKVRGPKHRALAAQREREQTPSVLAQVATDLTKLPAEPTYGLEAIVEQLAELFGSRDPRSVLLVGPSGVGKTAAVRELVQHRATLNLGATPFWTTSGARLVAGMTGFGMWQERCKKVVREAARRHAIVHLGSLVELMGVGKSEHNSMGIAAFLRPYLARGELLAIAECTPEQLPVIEREDPHLLDVFHRLEVAEPDVALGRSILSYCAANAPMALRKPLDNDTLETIDRLHRRYATYSAYPGRPLRFLRNLLEDRRDTAEVLPGDVMDAFTRETGLPRVLLDPRVPIDMEATRGWFESRVLGQPEAVELVVDLLAATKAGLTRPRKPIASLLFIGPTGVGKTEMAKALAEFLFGGRERLTRFDMSEFADPVSVQRLVGGVFGSEGLLTSRIREQPFSVLLLDEFEKAHPLFLDLLLQVLGEGRLTDAAGRLADFCNTVVILTSNLGAESFQQSAFGLAGDQADGAAAQRRAARDHFVRAVQEHVRPELFNRIDCLVPFAALDAATIRHIAAGHLRKLETREGIRYRGVALTLADGVVDHLARAGFDSRYGARPLLRAVERELLAPLAEQMNRHSADLALAVNVRLAGSALQVDVKPRLDAGGRVLGAGTAEASLVEAARACVDLRRQVQALERSASVRELNNDLFQLERDQKRFDKALRRHALRQTQLARAPEEVRRRVSLKTPRVLAADQERMTRIARLQQIVERVGDLAEFCRHLENDALETLYAGLGAAGSTPAKLNAAEAPLRQAWLDLLLVFHGRQFDSPDTQTLALFSEAPNALLELTAAYLALAYQLRLGVEMMIYRAPGVVKARASEEDEPEGETQTGSPPAQFWRKHTLIASATARQPEREVLTREPVADPKTFLATPPARVLGLAMRLRGPAVAPRFATEGGLHIFRNPKESQPGKCLVDTSELDLAAYIPPAGIARRGAIGTQNRRRTYDRGQQILDDAQLERKIPWQGRPLHDALTDALAEDLRRRLLQLLEER